jgi:hypothetical protein
MKMLGLLLQWLSVLRAGTLSSSSVCPAGGAEPGVCFHGDKMGDTPVTPSAAECCATCANRSAAGVPGPACMAWTRIESSMYKPGLDGQCHMFGSAAVTRDRSTPALNCTSGFAPLSPPSPPHGDAPLVVALGVPELVLDARGIVANTSAGLHRVARRPQKMGMVVKPEHPWEAWLGFYNSVVQVTPTLFHLYYGCAGPANGTVTFLCLATSEDGVTFTKPLNLGLYEYAGSTDNNIIWVTPYELLPGGGGTNGGHGGTGWANSVLFDNRADVPANQRFKLLYDTDTGAFSGRHLLVATSNDGMHWSQLLMHSTPNGSLVDHSEFGDTNTCLLWVARLNRYVAFGRIDASTPGAICASGNARRVGVIFEGGNPSSSTPFAERHFNTPPDAIFHNQPGLDPGCVDFYNPAAVDVAGVTFIFPSATLHLQQQTQPSSFPSPYDSCRSTNDGFMDVRMAWSRMEVGQPLLFEQLGTAPVVPRGMGRRNPLTGIYDQGNAEWDAGMVFMGTGLVAAPSAPGTVSQFYFGSQCECPTLWCLFFSATPRAQVSGAVWPDDSCVCGHCCLQSRTRLRRTISASSIPRRSGGSGGSSGGRRVSSPSPAVSTSIARSATTPPRRVACCSHAQSCCHPVSTELREGRWRLRLL